MFCRRCGEQLPENTKFCTKCGSNIQDINSNTTQLNQNNMSVNTKPKSHFLFIYLILIGLSMAFFFVPWIIHLIFSINGITMNESIDAVMRVLQIIVPMFVIPFGWIPALIYDNIKRNQNKRK